MAAAINEYGDIVGFYTADGRTHGYLVSGGEFSTIDFPDASYTSAIGINPRGDIVDIITVPTASTMAFC